jgi:hypothetical protein
MDDSAVLQSGRSVGGDYEGRNPGKYSQSFLVSCRRHRLSLLRQRTKDAASLVAGERKIN